MKCIYQDTFIEFIRDLRFGIPKLICQPVSLHLLVFTSRTMEELDLKCLVDDVNHNIYAVWNKKMENEIWISNNESRIKIRNANSFLHKTVKVSKTIDEVRE